MAFKMRSMRSAAIYMLIAIMMVLAVSTTATTQKDPCESCCRGVAPPDLGGCYKMGCTCGNVCDYCCSVGGNKDICAAVTCPKCDKDKPKPDHHHKPKCDVCCTKDAYKYKRCYKIRLSAAACRGCPKPKPKPKPLCHECCSTGKNPYAKKCKWLRLASWECKGCPKPDPKPVCNKCCDTAKHPKPDYCKKALIPRGACDGCPKPDPKPECSPCCPQAKEPRPRYCIYAKPGNCDDCTLPEDNDVCGVAAEKRFEFKIKGQRCDKAVDYIKDQLKKKGAQDCIKDYQILKRCDAVVTKDFRVDRVRIFCDKPTNEVCFDVING